MKGVVSVTLFILHEILACLILTSINSVNATPIQCKDASGNDIDWFIAYKLPKIKESSNRLIKSGLGFAYILPGVSEWTVSPQSINDSQSLVGITLQPLYDKQNHDGDATAYIAYNDQPPVGPTADSGGHTKGIILTNATGGIWLQHSVPHFPLLDKSKLEFSYPATGIHNGQILHCMSLKLKEVDNIGNILAITKPKVYNYTMPKGLIEILPTLDKILGNHAGGTKGHVSHDQENQMQGPDVNHNLIQVQNAGRTVYSFAKGPSFHEEIYSDWIAPKYGSELDVQSWLNGPHADPSNCTTINLKVFNIDEKEVAGSKFSTHNDHSKWAVGAAEQPVICIGDLNRMEHQEQRGGTVNCFDDPIVWKAFKNLVVTTQPCSKPVSEDEDFHSQKHQQSFFTKVRNKLISLYRRLFSGF